MTPRQTGPGRRSMQHHRDRRITAIIVAMLVGLVSFASFVSPAGAATSGEPKDWSTTCSSAALGLDKDTLGHAPVLTDDKAPGGGPITAEPDSRGRWVPVILVHGWISKSTHEEERSGTFSHVIDLTANRMGPASGDRSLVGQFQGIPGAAVFTFDYSPYAARWVDDSHLGPALGKVIDCLYAASGKQKVILVGHSMGGLISRWAASQPGSTGSTRVGEISLGVTFGTPETGSLAAQIGAFIADPATAAANLTGTQQGLLPSQATVLGSILSTCGRLSSDQIETGTLCDRIPVQARTFASDAGVALRYGSPQLRALAPWPEGIILDAVAGDTHFSVPKIGWFAKPWDVDRIPMGDMIVTRGSALSKASLASDTTCSYQMSAGRAVADQVGLFFGLTSKADVAQQPLGAFSGPCFHSSLMRGRELTNEALGAVADDIAARQPVTEKELLSAPVPASCQHKAGKLKNGTLPGLQDGQGSMDLAWRVGRQPKKNVLQFGDFTGDGIGDAAVVLYCYAGGVSWPEIIAFYGRTGSAKEPVGLRLLAWKYTTDIVDTPGGQNAFVQSMTPTGNGIRSSWVTQQEGDAGCCPTTTVTATVRLDHGKIIASDVVRETEQPTATKFFAALARGDASAARSVAAADVLTAVQADLDAVPALKAAAATKPTCIGLISLDQPEPIDTALGIGGYDVPTFSEVNRFCYVATPGGEYGVAGLRNGPDGWRVTWWRLLPELGD